MPASLLLTWPRHTLRPSIVMPNQAVFSRTGGRTIGGISRSTRTDRGYWTIGYKGVPLKDVNSRKSWNAIRTRLSGTSGILAIPVWSNDTVPWENGVIDGELLMSHTDETTMSDDTEYAQTAQPYVQMAADAAIGDTVVTLRIVSGITNLVGTRFSHNHAMYETGPATAEPVGALWNMPIFPAIRAAIPADTYLEYALPTCLVHLASDRDMDAAFSASNFDMRDVEFVEAVDYWNDLALAAS